ncbi:MAG: septum formation initiator [Sulfurospirillaceae bacterium]|jgi:hypothetical protein|nr:septum formation initiator [Sulfurospirillaceae bacterium]MCK9546161.1 septum formation initiator [Sulfurospirillaceae bacterium]MDY0237788.1 septum formation initiator [Campylobacterales bacterium]NLM99426.1 septum formation initiator [Campylobacteraceae bacterium]
MSEDLKDYRAQKDKFDLFRGSTFKFLITGLVVVIFGVYIGTILFGSSSLDVLLGLQNDKTLLHERIEALKKENALLQKTYFELRQLDPDLYKE